MMRTLVLMVSLLFLASAQAAGFGRLFFTPEQRAKLDEDYARSVTTMGETGSVITVNGIVQRRGGARTVWINGVPQPAGKSDERHPTSAPVAIPGRPRPVEVKVGEKVLLEAPSAPVETAPK